MTEPVTLYSILFAAAFLAGFVDTLAGGGGLITVPILMGLGFTPQVALGTNKFQASFGSGIATAHFVRKGAVQLTKAWPGILFTAAGAAVGTWAVQQVKADFMRQLIPPLLAAIALYTLVTPDLGRAVRQPRMAPWPFYLLMGLTLGFYDGFFGPGVGSFWVMAFMLLRGMDMRDGTAHTKVMNFTSNVVSLGVFLLGGCVRFGPGLVMAAGQLLGSRIAAGLVLSKGARFIRPVFIAAVMVRGRIRAEGGARKAECGRRTRNVEGGTRSGEWDNRPVGAPTSARKKRRGTWIAEGVGISHPKPFIFQGRRLGGWLDISPNGAYCERDINARSSWGEQCGPLGCVLGRPGSCGADHGKIALKC